MFEGSSARVLNTEHKRLHSAPFFLSIECTFILLEDHYDGTSRCMTVLYSTLMSTEKLRFCMFTQTIPAWKINGPNMIQPVVSEVINRSIINRNDVITKQKGAFGVKSNMFYVSYGVTITRCFLAPTTYMAIEKALNNTAQVLNHVTWIMTRMHMLFACLESARWRSESWNQSTAIPIRTYEKYYKNILKISWQFCAQFPEIIEIFKVVRHYNIWV